MTASAGGTDLKTYFEEAKRWDQDRLAAAERFSGVSATTAMTPAIASAPAPAATIQASRREA